MTADLVPYTLRIFVLCRHDRPYYARGWCKSCWVRWCNAGKPSSGPPPLMSLDRQNAARRANAACGVAARAARAAERFEDYTWIRDANETPEAAGARIHVSRSTRFRYEIRFRKGHAA